jgi:hypothetical protein
MIIQSEFEEQERVEDEIDREEIKEEAELDERQLEEDAQYKNPPQW